MEIPHQQTKKSKLTLYILIAMVLGIIVGYFVHENSEAATIKTFSDNAKLLTTIFLRMVQMIIAPIVFATLVVGMELNKKEFDAVKMMRDIRTKISSETQNMSFDELKVYIKQKLIEKNVKIIGQ